MSISNEDLKRLTNEQAKRIAELEKRINSLEQEEQEWLFTQLEERNDCIAELRAALKPFAAYYSSYCNNLDPDDCVICEADEEENNLTVGLFRKAHKVLGEM